MSFPLSFILIPYAVVMAIFLFVMLVDILHLAHFGTSDAVALLAILIFFAGTAAILGLTLILLQTTNWAQPVTIGLAFPTTIF